MTEENERVGQTLSQSFSGKILDATEFLGDLTVTVRGEDAHEVLERLLKDPDLDYDFLVDVTAVDFLKLARKPRFGVVYNLCSRRRVHRMRVMAMVDEDTCQIRTATDLWNGAEWPEREVYDLFGIRFEGHPDLRRIMMPDTFEDHPLRKDYPLRGRGERNRFPIVTRIQT